MQSAAIQRRTDTEVKPRIGQRADSLPEKIRRYRQQYRHDILGFARDRLRLKQLSGEPSLDEDSKRSWELDAGQIKILESVCDIVRKQDGVPTVVNHEGKPWITVASMRGGAKTTTVGVVMHWFNFIFSGREVITAPKLEQVTTRIWPAFRKVYYRAEPWYRSLLEVNARSIRWAPGIKGHEDHIAYAETAAKPENLAGHQYRHILVAVEEASGVLEPLWPTILGLGSAAQVQIVLIISNPTTRTGTFADSHLKPSEARNWHRIAISLDEARRVNRTWVAQIEGKYGKSSPVVRVHCYGLFPLEDATQIMAYEWLSAARSADPQGDGSLPRRRITVDVGAGVSETVLIAADHYQSKIVGVAMRRFSHDTGSASFAAAEAAERMWNELGCDTKRGDNIVVDANQLGDGTYGYLLKRNLPVIGYKGGTAASNPKRWRNRRCQSYLMARDAYREKRIAYGANFVVDEVDWDDFEAQLCAIRSRDTGDRLEDIEPKADMIARTGISPDIADAWSMQFVTATPVYATETRTSGVEVFTTPSTAVIEDAY